MARQREPRYMNRKVTAEADHHKCQSCGADDDTVVAAHSNQGRHGKGMGRKAHDCFVAYLCAACHSWLDQGGSSKIMKDSVWDAAHKKSILLFVHLLYAKGKALLESVE